MDKIKFEDGKLIEKAYVTVNGEKAEVQPAVYEGKTPLKAYNLNKMQDNMEKEINKVQEHVEEATKVTSIMPGGNSVQETREGYNLLLNTGVSRNHNGVDFTVNEDGTVLANGTASALAQISIAKNITFPAGTYTIKDVLLYVTDIGWVGGFEGSITKTFEKEFTITDTFIQVQSGETVNNKIFYPMIVEGSYTAETMPPYEPYGKSPSIEYEAPIKSVGDNVNLYNKETSTNGYYTDAKGVSVASAPSSSSDFINVEVGQSYYSNKTISLAYFNESKAPVGILTNLFSGKFTPNYPYVKANVNINDKDTLKIEKGTKATGYSPYGQGSIDIKQENENLLNARYGVNIRGNDTYDIYNIKPNTKYTLYLKQKCIALGTSPLCQHWIAYKRIDGSIIKQNAICSFNWNNEGEERGVTSIITTPENCTSITLDLSPYVNYNVSSTIQHLEAMLCEGENESYVPYEEQNIVITTQKPFRAVGDTRDKFVKVNGMWYEKHDIDRYIVTGDENITIPENQGNHNQTITFYLHINNVSQNLEKNVMCNYLPGKRNAEWSADTIGIWNNEYNYINFSIEKNQFSSLDQAGIKNKFKNLYNLNKPLYFDFVTREPELIPCTAEQIKALAEISSAYGEGLTNITCEDEVEPVIEIEKESKEAAHAEIIKLIVSLSEEIEKLKATK